MATYGRLQYDEDNADGKVTVNDPFKIGQKVSCD